MKTIFLFSLSSQFNRSRNLSDGTSQPVTGKDSTDAFSFEQGHLEVGSVGLKPSRSFDMLTNAQKKEEESEGGEADLFSLSLGSSHSLPYGASPK